MKFHLPDRMNAHNSRSLVSFSESLVSVLLLKHLSYTIDGDNFPSRASPDTLHDLTTDSLLCPMARKRLTTV